MNASPEESIKRIQREILTTKTEIGNVERFRETVEKAIAELTGRKYAPLDKALKEYGTFGEIHNAYGYDYISEKRFRNLKKLHDERQNDPKTSGLRVRQPLQGDANQQKERRVER